MRSVFKQFLKTYPWRRLRRRPLGAAAPGGGGIFSKYLEIRPLFSKYLEKQPIHIFLIATFHFFQITIIYKGAQVTTPSRVIVDLALPDVIRHSGEFGQY